MADWTSQLYLLIQAGDYRNICCSWVGKESEGTNMLLKILSYILLTASARAYRF